MNGIKLFLDTNAIIALLQGNEKVSAILSTADWVGTSAVCAIEFLSFSLLPLHDRSLFIDFVQTIEVIPVTADIALLANIADIKKNNNLKLPDAIVAASALQQSATLISNDKHFSRIRQLNTISFELP